MLKQVFAERSLSKIAGVFDDERAARKARARLLDAASLHDWQVALLAPSARPDLRSLRVG
ncbi:MAG: hypothetical protein AB7P21_14300 [Lautropia sp.]